MDNTQNQREIRGCKRRKLLVNDSDDVSKTQENQPNYFDTLPDEIHLEILKKIPQLELEESVGLVCRRFNRIIEDRSLWKKVVRKYSQLKRGEVGKWMRRQVQDLTLHYVTIPSSSLLPALEVPQASWYLNAMCLLNLRNPPDDLLQIFNKCKHLTKVHLTLIHVNNDVLVAISENTNIEMLHLRCVRGLEPVGLAILLKNLRKLEKFYIEVDSWFTPILNSPPNLNSICENLAPSLLDLRLGSIICRYGLLTDSHIAHIVRNCPLLQRLDLPFAIELTARSTESLRNLKYLRTLNLHRRHHIRPADFLAMATDMESLVELDIHALGRSREERSEITELFDVNIIEENILWCVGTFNTRFNVVKFRY